jgi:hypothetical protein
MCRLTGGAFTQGWAMHTYSQNGKFIATMNVKLSNFITHQRKGGIHDIYR